MKARHFSGTWQRNRQKVSVTGKHESLVEKTIALLNWEHNVYGISSSTEYDIC